MTSDEHFADAVVALAPRLGGPNGSISGLNRLSGGATQEIWRFDLGSEPLILRRARGGDLVGDTGIGLEAEAELHVAVGAANVPVPAVRYILEADDDLGHGFIMAFVEGETLGGRIVKQEASQPVGLARQCGEILARIHAIDPAPFPKIDYFSPADLVAYWQELYRATNWPRPVFEFALRWLDAHCPPPPAIPRLVHGDFRNGNLMVGPEGVRAVLDWELAHVGDPMEDLGWLCVNSWRFGAVDSPVGGFGGYDELFESYETAGGDNIDRNAVKWWEVFGTLRWGIMCSGMAASFRDTDPTVERAMIARRTSETEIDLLRLLKD